MLRAFGTDSSKNERFRIWQWLPLYLSVMLGVAEMNVFPPELDVPVREIKRVKYPDEINPEKFEQDYVKTSEPVIIEGLIDDWLQIKDEFFPFWNGSWRFERGQEDIEVNYDALDSRMYRFDDYNPTILLNPGRIHLPLWAFLEVGYIRRDILNIGKPVRQINWTEHKDLWERLHWEVRVKNVPKTFSLNMPYSFSPFTCKLRDLVPLAYYYANDVSALPEKLKYVISHQAKKIMPNWGEPQRSCCWITPGGPWTGPAHEDEVEDVEANGFDRGWVPGPGKDHRIFSCFHFDRWDNLHSVMSGEKDIFLVPPDKGKVLKGTRFADQKQWVMSPMDNYGQDLAKAVQPEAAYLKPTLLHNHGLTECFSDQSAVVPISSAEYNRNQTGGQWPDEVDFPIRRGRLRKGDTLYLPAYHWHFVATHSPPNLGKGDDSDEGAFAASVNHWWEPIHGFDNHKRWTMQNEIRSRSNTRIGEPKDMLSTLNHLDYTSGRIDQSKAVMSDEMVMKSLLSDGKPQDEKKEEEKQETAANSSVFAAGSWVQIVGLSSESGQKLNGQNATVISENATAGRVVVEFEDGMRKALKTENVDVSLAAAMPRRFAKGSWVEVKGLGSKDGQKMNGDNAVVIAFNSTGRVTVEFEGGARKALKHENLGLPEYKWEIHGEPTTAEEMEIEAHNQGVRKLFEGVGELAAHEKSMNQGGTMLNALSFSATLLIGLFAGSWVTHALFCSRRDAFAACEEPLLAT